MFHSLPAAAIAGQTTFLAFAAEEPLRRYFVSSAVVLGFLTHLVLDEIWSVKMGWFGPKVKKSFGTALKFHGPDLWPNLIAYALALILGGLAAGDAAWTERAAAARQHNARGTRRALIPVLVAHPDLEVYNTPLAALLSARDTAPGGQRIAGHVHAAKLEIDFPGPASVAGPVRQQLDHDMLLPTAIHHDVRQFVVLGCILPVIVDAMPVLHCRRPPHDVRRRHRPLHQALYVLANLDIVEDSALNIPHRLGPYRRIIVLMERSKRSPASVS
jgi:hypothetical protein